ncbi:MAG: hypothetical protein TR69_WS6001001032 [candidate division WS6 bacterium OLB20]|uniref:Secreted protein n=1 Tax=candidate division WS6 bacterium OLB20 TaxID=1617426 RepID=A0A136LZF6_9BACT|nr:MAG: hypothetical protein TR69_WS6001001032 [candidate division WS6 bacterium OLB20]
MLKRLLSLVAVFMLAGTFLSPAKVSAVESTNVQLKGEAGEVIFVPTCSWSYPEGFYSDTSAYTYLGRVPVSEPSSKYPGTWECDTVVKHMIRLNWISYWSPLSSNYPGIGKFTIRSRGENPSAPELGFHTDQTYDIMSIQILNHLYGDSKINYFTTSKTDMVMHKYVGGTPVAIDLESVNYQLKKNPRCPGGQHDRMNCKWIHSFKTDSLQTATYRLTFTDSYGQGPGAADDGVYQVFFFLTR